MKTLTTYAKHLLVWFTLLLTFGCGGSDGGSTTTTVSGSVFAGPTAGATVIVKNSAGTVVAGPVTTGSDGSYTVAIPTSALAADLTFEANGGTFPDEATETTGVTMGALSAHVTGGSLTAGSNVTIDPSSTIVRKLVAAGMTRTAAENAFGTAFGYTPDASVRPSFCNMSTSSTDKQRLAGLRAAAFSRLTMDLGLTPVQQFELLQALADDLSDGVLDGKKYGVPVTTASGTRIPADIINLFSSALVNFLSSAQNNSRLTSDRIGTLPFSKTALTPSYKVEYLPGMMAAAQGKSSFKIKLSNIDGTPAIGKTVTLMPYMHMPTKSHTTPVDPVIDNGDGTYSCTVYYLMASMMNGISMGFWELKVVIGTGAAIETARFYPPVGMAMGTTPRVTLKGVADSIAVMGTTEKRAYNIFFDGLSASGGTYTFKLFVSAKESMTNWPGVSPGVQLHDTTGAAFPVSAMTVEVSTDSATWLPAIDSGNGHWSVGGMTGFATGSARNVYVRITVNSEQKTTDGNVIAADGRNSFQTFAVIPNP